MIVIPAIDLIDGQCVRLWKGRFDRKTTFERAPADIAAEYAATGATRLHVIDLDAARAGEPRNLETLRAIAAAAPGLEIQWGGGMRTESAVKSALAASASRVLVGSVAVNEPATLGDWIHRFGPDRIIAAIDVRTLAVGPTSADRSQLKTQYSQLFYTPVVAAWTRQSDRHLFDVLDELVALELTHLLSTDVDRDGTGDGPNLDLYRELVARYPDLEVQASGGVSSAGDLARLEESGVAAVVVGRALLDGTLKPEDVLC